MDKLSSIKKACKIGDKVFGLVVSNFSKFKTEKEVSKFILDGFRKFGVSKAFPPIVASGKGGSEPHHVPTNEKLRGGFCVIDIGCRVNGYCSDMTRMVFIGKPTNKDKEIYNLVLEAQVESMKKVKVGAPYKEIDLFSRKVLGRNKKYFIHSLGHGVGKWIHMNPKIYPKSKHFVNVGDVITIEPGVYFKNKFGIRIEDTLLVKSNGIEVLTRSSKRLVVIRT